jgi:hypothetical protein
MKKATATMIFLMTMILLPACGGDRNASGAGAATAKAPSHGETATPAGKAYDCAYFSFTLAEGWEAGPLTFGMVNVLPKGKVSPGLYFKFEGDGNAAGSAEGSIRSMIQNYGGSPMVDSVIAGVGFKTTTYTFSGMNQTMHVAFRNGTKITITIEGVKAGDNPDIRSMLASVAFK